MAFKKPGTYLVIVLAIVHILVSIISSTMLIYASISFGQMPAFKKHKNISAIGFFVVFSIVSEYIMTKLGYADLMRCFHPSMLDTTTYFRVLTRQILVRQ